MSQAKRSSSQVMVLTEKQRNKLTNDAETILLSLINADSKYVCPVTTDCAAVHLQLCSSKPNHIPSFNFLN